MDLREIFPEVFAYVLNYKYLWGVDQHWYAIKVFWKRTARMKDVLDELGMEYYAQNVMPSYFFVHTDGASIKRLADSQFGFMYLYCDRATRKPAVVPDKEVEIFKIMTQAAATGLEFLDGNPEKYKVGDLVRVTDGPFKGAEGYVRRIRKDRRLVVIISGIAAVATSFIPPDLLEKVETQPEVSTQQ